MALERDWGKIYESIYCNDQQNDMLHKITKDDNNAKYVSELMDLRKQFAQHQGDLNAKQFYPPVYAAFLAVMTSFLAIEYSLLDKINGTLCSIPAVLSIVILIAIIIVGIVTRMHIKKWSQEIKKASIRTIASKDKTEDVKLLMKKSKDTK